MEINLGKIEDIESISEDTYYRACKQGKLVSVHELSKLEAEFNSICQQIDEAWTKAKQITEKAQK